MLPSFARLSLNHTAPVGGRRKLPDGRTLVEESDSEEEKKEEPDPWANTRLADDKFAPDPNAPAPLPPRPPPVPQPAAAAPPKKKRRTKEESAAYQAELARQRDARQEEEDRKKVEATWESIFSRLMTRLTNDAKELEKRETAKKKKAEQAAGRIAKAEEKVAERQAKDAAKDEAKAETAKRKAEEKAVKQEEKAVKEEEKAKGAAEEKAVKDAKASERAAIKTMADELAREKANKAALAARAKEIGQAAAEREARCEEAWSAAHRLRFQLERLYDAVQFDIVDWLRTVDVDDPNAEKLPVWMKAVRQYAAFVRTQLANAKAEADPASWDPDRDSDKGWSVVAYDADLLKQRDAERVVEDSFRKRLRNETYVRKYRQHIEEHVQLVRWQLSTLGRDVNDTFTDLKRDCPEWVGDPQPAWMGAVLDVAKRIEDMVGQLTLDEEPGTEEDPNPTWGRILKATGDMKNSAAWPLGARQLAAFYDQLFADEREFEGRIGEYSGELQGGKAKNHREKFIEEADQQKELERLLRKKQARQRAGGGKYKLPSGKAEPGVLRPGASKAEARSQSLGDLPSEDEEESDDDDDTMQSGTIVALGAQRAEGLSDKEARQLERKEQDEMDDQSEPLQLILETRLRAGWVAPPKGFPDWTKAKTDRVRKALQEMWTKVLRKLMGVTEDELLTMEVFSAEPEEVTKKNKQNAKNAGKWETWYHVSVLISNEDAKAKQRINVIVDRVNREMDEEFFDKLLKKEVNGVKVREVLADREAMENLGYVDTLAYVVSDAEPTEEELEFMEQARNDRGQPSFPNWIVVRTNEPELFKAWLREVRQIFRQAELARYVEKQRVEHSAQGLNKDQQDEVDQDVEEESKEAAEEYAKEDEEAELIKETLQAVAARSVAQAPKPRQRGNVVKSKRGKKEVKEEVKEEEPEGGPGKGPGPKPGKKSK